MKSNAFLGDVMLDRIMLIATNLAEEVYVSIDRLRTLEMVLAAKNVVRPEEIEDFKPGEHEQEVLKQLREQFVARIFADAMQPVSQPNGPMTARKEVR